MKRHPILSSKSVFEGRVFDVVVDEIRLPDGSTATREVVRHPGAVAVVAVLDGRVLMVRQNRHAVGQDLLELPAGKLDQEGEDAQTCARRELQEETGYRCGTLEPLVGFLASPGFSDERIQLFFTADASPAGPPPTSDEGEPISVEWLPLSRAFQAIWAGEVVDSKSIIGLLLAAERAGGERVR